MWVQIFCGAIGSIVLYYLLTLIDSNNLTLLLEEHGFNLIILSFVVVMSYAGLLARFLWFMSYGLGQFGKPPGR